MIDALSDSMLTVTRGEFLQEWQSKKDPTFAFGALRLHDVNLIVFILQGVHRIEQVIQIDPHKSVRFVCSVLARWIALVHNLKVQVENDALGYTIGKR